MTLHAEAHQMGKNHKYICIPKRIAHFMDPKPAH